MKKSGVGEKRPRDTEDQNKAVEFIPGLKLSQHPLEQRKKLFLKKLHNIVRSKSLHPTEFEGYTIRERFSKMGWEQLLNMKCDKIYRRVVIEWMSSLTRNGDELRGIVDGKSYSITPAVIRDVLGVDTRKDLPYGRFSEVPIVENGSRWLEACNTVFGLHENGKGFNGYSRCKMTPLAKILWIIMFSEHHQQQGYGLYEVWPREIYLLHALYTGDVLYSFALLMIDDIWNMYEDENQHSIPHASYISMILDRLGAVSKDESAEMFSPIHCVISRTSCDQVYMLESPTEYIVDDRVTKQRVTFPKKVINGEAACQSSHADMTKLLNMHQKMVQGSNIRKQMTHQVFEAEREEQEKGKWADEKERQAELLYEERGKQAEEREKRAEEREKWAEERVRQAEILAREREKRVEERERRAEEREKWAEERERRAEERERQSEIRIREREKRVEGRAEEREKKADIWIQEREKCAEERVKQAHEREKRAIEREKQSEIWIREREKFAEEREQWAEEREREAEIRVLETEKRVEEMEIGAKERDKMAEIRAQEREKWAEDAEVRAQEKERRAEDIERQAEIRAQEMIRRAEEIAKKAETRARLKEKQTVQETM